MPNYNLHRSCLKQIVWWSTVLLLLYCELQNPSAESMCSPCGASICHAIYHTFNNGATDTHCIMHLLGQWYRSKRSVCIAIYTGYAKYHFIHYLGNTHWSLVSSIFHVILLYHTCHKCTASKWHNISIWSILFGNTELVVRNTFCVIHINKLQVFDSAIISFIHLSVLSKCRSVLTHH